MPINPNIDPSIRGEIPKVEDLKEKFGEILHEELDGIDHTVSYDEAIDRAVERLFDAVTQLAMMDPHG